VSAQPADITAKSAVTELSADAKPTRVGAIDCVTGTSARPSQSHIRSGAGIFGEELAAAESSSIPADGSLVTYTTFDGKQQLQLRQYNGKYVAFLISDADLALTSLQFIRRQIDRYDRVYTYLRDFLGEEPAGDGLLRIAVVDDSPASFGWVGVKGVETSQAWFNSYQEGRDLMYTVVKHEMIHNFDHLSSFLFNAPDPAHSWTDFMQPYLEVYNRQGFTDESSVQPEEWLRIMTDQFFTSFLSFPGRTWLTCVQNAACDGNNMAQHAQGGLVLRVAQAYGTANMKRWYPIAQQMVTSRNLSSTSMTGVQRNDLLFESLSKTTGDSLACFADSITWPISDSLRTTLSVMPSSARVNRFETLPDGIY
jgi:hypothetical protein